MGKLLLSGRAPTATSPVVCGSLVVLLLNDWILAPRWPSWATGKASDVVGLIVLGAVAVDVADAVFRNERATPWICAVLGVSFVFVKSLELGAIMYQQLNQAIVEAADALWPGEFEFHASIVVDQTDLFALPALTVPLLLRWRQIRRASSTEAPAVYSHPEVRR